MRSATPDDESENVDLLGLYERLFEQYDAVEVDATFAPNLQKLDRLLEKGVYDKDKSSQQLEDIRNFVDEMKHYGFYQVVQMRPAIEPPTLNKGAISPPTVRSDPGNQSTGNTGAINSPTVLEAMGMSFAELSKHLNSMLDALQQKQQIPNVEARIKELFVILESKIPIWATTTTLPLQIVNRIRTEFPALVQPRVDAPVIEKVLWRFLPPGETGKTRPFKAVLEFHKRHPELTLDKSRLVYAFSLKPEHVYIGEDEFDSYIAFVFSNTQRVLLENPIEGNAAYVFFGDWKFLSKLPKTELLRHHGREVKRAIHIGRWRTRVTRLLKIRKRSKKKGAKGSQSKGSSKGSRLHNSQNE